MAADFALRWSGVSAGTISSPGVSGQIHGRTVLAGVALRAGFDRFEEDSFAGDFRVVAFFADAFFAVALRDVGAFFDVDLDADFFEDVFRAGTFAPAARASEIPIAMACFRLLTFRPDPPLFNLPSPNSCMTFETFFCAFAPYAAICDASLCTCYRATCGPVPDGLVE